MLLGAIALHSHISLHTHREAWWQSPTPRATPPPCSRLVTCWGGSTAPAPDLRLCQCKPGRENLIELPLHYPTPCGLWEGSAAHRLCLELGDSFTGHFLSSGGGGGGSAELIWLTVSWWPVLVLLLAPVCWQPYSGSCEHRGRPPSILLRDLRSGQCVPHPFPVGTSVVHPGHTRPVSSLPLD